MEYLKPPLVEAVIEIRFQREWDIEDVRRIGDKYRERFPVEHHEVALNFAAQMTNEQTSHADVSQQLVKLSLLNADQTEGVVFLRNGILAIRRAPYNGWNALKDLISELYKIHRDEMGYQKIVRIGTRFINRLDISNENIELADYLTLVPSDPDELVTDIVEFSYRTVYRLKDTRFRAIYTAGSTAPAVPGRASIIHDIDCFTEEDVPQRIDGIDELLSQLRVAKNQFFERSLTDLARKLFN